MNRPLVDNAADPRQIKEAGKKEKKRSLGQSEDLRFILGDARGRRFVWRVLEECRAYQSVFNTNSLITHYNAGRQDLGHWLLSEVTGCDENLYFQMFKENTQLGKGQLDG